MKEFAKQNLSVNIPAQLLYDFQRAAHRQGTPLEQAVAQMTGWFLQKAPEAVQVRPLEKGDTTEFHATLTPAHYKALQQIAEVQGLSMDSVVTQMITWYFNIFDDVVSSYVEDDTTQALLNALLPDGRQQLDDNVVNLFDQG